jgi:Ca2+-binding EF-hand superfamily protein
LFTRTGNGVRRGIDFQEVIMWLNELEQDLRRDLQDVASDLRWSIVELTQIAERLSEAQNDADAQALLRKCEVLQAGEKRLMAYADEVKARVIHRTKAE